MVKIEITGGERPHQIELGGMILKTGYYRTYYSATIERGDTLDEIARQLGADHQDLYQQNQELLGKDLAAIQLQEGQVLTYSTPGSRGLTITM